MKVSMVHPST